MQQFGISAFNSSVATRIRWGGKWVHLAAHNFSLFAIFLPKISKIGGNLRKLWKKNNFAQFFGDTVYAYEYFNLKCTNVVWRPSSVRTRWGSLQRTTNHLVRFMGPLPGREGKGKKGKWGRGNGKRREKKSMKKGKNRRREGRERKNLPHHFRGDRHPFVGCRFLRFNMVGISGFKTRPISCGVCGTETNYHHTIIVINFSTTRYNAQKLPGNISKKQTRKWRGRKSKHP